MVGWHHELNGYEFEQALGLIAVARKTTTMFNKRVGILVSFLILEEMLLAFHC